MDWVQYAYESIFIGDEFDDDNLASYQIYPVYTVGYDNEFNGNTYSGVANSGFVLPTI